MLTLMTVTLFVLDALDGGLGGDSRVLGDSIAANSVKASFERSGDFHGKRRRIMQQ